ncbi:MAG TPA: methyltransferase [Acidimicrobiia bacterium]|nr:methyltransferase [Acidimicrobiia bacterium]
MIPASIRAGSYTVFVVGLWAVGLPAILARQPAGGFFLSWRGPVLVGFGVALVVAGALVVNRAATQLAGRGVGLFSVAPGPVLVTDGWYGRLRNPIDVGILLVALGAAVALDLSRVWIIPMAAVVNGVAGAGFYEDRRLLEAFGDEFRDYRDRVRKWIPE